MAWFLKTEDSPLTTVDQPGPLFARKHIRGVPPHDRLGIVDEWIWFFTKRNT